MSPLSKFDYDEQQARQVTDEPIVGERKVHRTETRAPVERRLTVEELVLDSEAWELGVVYHTYKIHDGRLGKLAAVAKELREQAKEELKQLREKANENK